MRDAIRKLDGGGDTFLFYCAVTSKLELGIGSDILTLYRLHSANRSSGLGPPGSGGWVRIRRYRTNRSVQWSMLANGAVRRTRRPFSWAIGSGVGSLSCILRRRDGRKSGSQENPRICLSTDPVPRHIYGTGSTQRSPSDTSVPDITSHSTMVLLHSASFAIRLVLVMPGKNFYQWRSELTSALSRLLIHGYALRLTCESFSSPAPVPPFLREKNCGSFETA